MRTPPQAKLQGKTYRPIRFPVQTNWQVHEANQRKDSESRMRKSCMSGSMRGMRGRTVLPFLPSQLNYE